MMGRWATALCDARVELSRKITTVRMRRGDEGSRLFLVATREAACSCGQLKLIAEGEPVRVSVCHCLACQRRTGSAFGFQARFPRDRIDIIGSSDQYTRISDDGHPRTFSFCPECGATVYYMLASAPELVAVPAGAFADPSFPSPSFSVWESRKHVWVTIRPDVERHP